MVIRPRHKAEVLGQVAEEIQAQVTGWVAEHRHDPIQPEPDIPAHSSTPLVQARGLNSAQPLPSSCYRGSRTSRITRALLSFTLLSAPAPAPPIRRQEMFMPVLRVYADQETLTEEESRGCQRGVRAWRRWERG